MKIKINAFTIMEVTVVMLLASITIAIAFMAYSLISRSYFQFDEKNKKLAEFLLMDHLLKKDTRVAHKIVRSDEGFYFETKHGIISYKTEAKYITRNQYGIRIDTFPIITKEPSYTFENRIVKSNEIIDKIRLEVEVLNLSSCLNYNKRYSAQELINATTSISNWPDNFLK